MAMFNRFLDLDGEILFKLKQAKLEEEHRKLEEAKKVTPPTPKTESTPDPLHPLMTVQEAADRLRLKKNTIYNWLSQGRLKRVKMGGWKIFIAREDVEEILANALAGRNTKPTE